MFAGVERQGREGFSSLLDGHAVPAHLSANGIQGGRRDGIELVAPIRCS